ncbi:Na+/H+ antiporter NhaA [Planctellipticum variicoloris]|uniref:Na+/H+ antiporter NhaA n=1 Tax=Planctellipticum variicoloris TaxID=3064265 RepID=UPI003013CB1F|nr:Na+/H+ antiporter NhaA [Planctomycetaceae bacterium SH412]
MIRDRDIKQNSRLPAEPIDRLVDPLNRFLHIQSASGVVLLLFTAAALVLANSPVSEDFLSFWKLTAGVSLGEFEFRHSLKHWINDGLMVVFFFAVGLEVKRELVLGELQSLRSAALPVAAAIGGMAVPALVYLTFQWGAAGERGWGIPMATDIAFVVGCMALLGSRVPRSLRVLLLTLAIADDIGAILVIAVGYAGELNLQSLMWGGVGIGAVVMLARNGVRSVPVYVAFGLGIWYAFHESGVHATVAGVVLGLLTPVRPWIHHGLFAELIDDLREFLHGDAWQDPEVRLDMLKSAKLAVREAASPAERLESLLHPWVSFVIMPLFAFANAGVRIEFAAFAEPVAVAVAVGLIIGKPLGIVLFSWLAVCAGLAQLPDGVSWKVLGAGGVLAGIGFTMSLFIAGLALQDPLLDAAKVGILSGSAVCATLGMALLRWLLPQPLRTESSSR